MLENIPSSLFYSRYLKNILTISKYCFTPIAIFTLGLFAWNSQELILKIVYKADIFYIVIASTVWISLHLLSPVFTVITLNTLDNKISYKQALFIHVERLPARYLPGGIWHTAARMVDFHRNGITKGHLSVLVLLENTIPVLVTLFIGGLIYIATHNMNIWVNLSVFSVIGTSIGFVLTVMLANRILTKDSDRISIKCYVKLLGTVIIFWMISATAFNSYLSAFPYISEGTTFLESSGAYLLSWGIGNLAIFAPQGIGVFETVAGSILNLPIPLGSAAVIIAGFRVIYLIADACAWGILQIVKYSNNRINYFSK